MIDFSSVAYVHRPLSELPQQVGQRKWVVVTDSHLDKAWDWSWCDAPRLVVPAGEASKCLQQVHLLYEQLASLKVDRQTVVVAVGGGVIGDLVGFAAATYLRGLPFWQVPTSLVAQVDSSLGGKVGVDLPAGKNLVGAFYPAECVYLDPDLLASLPLQQWQCGMAEVLKHALLDGPAHFAWLEDLPDLLDSSARAHLVLRSRQVKLDIVTRDPLERGDRAFLNLGHTLGHAIEAAQNYQGWNHGQAVAFGTLAALRLSQRRLGLDPQWERRFRGQMERYQLPQIRPELPLPEIREFLTRDKKNRNGQLTFVLLDRPGQAQLVSGLDWSEIETVWEELA
jgi:3-dehydroquinate synthase